MLLLSTITSTYGVCSFDIIIIRGTKAKSTNMPTTTSIHIALASSPNPNPKRPVGSPTML